MRAVAACPACGGAERRRLVRVETKYVPAGQALAYAHCSRCGLVYAEQVIDTDDALRDAYVAPYRSLGEEQFLRDTALRLSRNRYRKAWLDERLSALGRTAASRTALEIGAKDGSFLSLLKEDGWQVVGIDPNQRYAHWGQRHYGIEIRDGYFRAGAFEERRFGLAAAFLLFEHIEEPGVFLEAVRRVLGEGGVLYLETPNLAHIQQRQLIPTHPVLYSRRTLIQVLAHHGFRVLASAETGPGGLMTFDQLVVLAEPAPGPRPNGWEPAEDFDTARRYLERALQDDFPYAAPGAQHRMFQLASRVIGEPTATMLKQWYRRGLTWTGRKHRTAMAAGNGHPDAALPIPEPIREAWLQEALTAGHVRLLAAEPDERIRLKVLARVRAYRLSLEATEQLLLEERRR